MKTATRFGTDKCIDTALRVFEGFENRRAWEALLFPIHPRLHYMRCVHEVETAFTVILP